MTTATDAKEADEGLIAPLASKRFAAPGFAALSRSGVDGLICAFFGAEPAADSTARPMTDLDRALVQYVLASFVDIAGEVFKELDDTRFSIGDLLDEETFAQTFGEERERLVVMRFELTRDDAPLKVSLGLPAAFLAPHRRFLSTIPEPPALDSDEAWTRAIGESFSQSDLRLEAVLARRKVPLSTIARFKVGQTVPLEVGIASLITVECEEKPLFRGQVGRSRDHYVIRFEERIDPAQEFIDDILAD